MDMHGWSTTKEPFWKRYILVVICDFATRYAEAVALRSTDAEHVTEELVSIFHEWGYREKY